MYLNCLRKSACFCDHLVIRPHQNSRRLVSQNNSLRNPQRRHRISTCRLPGNDRPDHSPPESVERGGYRRGKAIAETRVFIDASFIAGDRLAVPPAELRHLRARRIRNGQLICLFNGRGDTASAAFELDTVVVIRVRSSARSSQDSPSANLAIAEAVSTASSASRSQMELTEAVPESCTLSVVVGLPKNAGRADWCVEKLTELGVCGISWARTERTFNQGEPSKGKMERWDRLAIAASKQSLRTTVPPVRHLRSFSDIIQLVNVHSTAFVLSPVGEPLLTDENISLVANSDAIVLIAGPEGGLTDSEERKLVDAGAKRIGLGSTRLRVETAITAAVATISQIGFRTEFKRTGG